MARITVNDALWDGQSTLQQGDVFGTSRTATSRPCQRPDPRRRTY